MGDESDEPRRVGIFGNIPVYNAEAEPFDNYLERLEAFFDVNHTSDEEKVSSLLVLLGAEMYKTLKNLLVPEVPKDKTFTELVTVLKEHYSPPRLEVAERYKFYTRTQQVGESVKDYIVALKQLSTNCNFDTFLDQALRDRLIVGLQDDSMVRKLLSATDLDFKAACKLVLDMEVVKKQSQIIKEEGGETPVMMVNDSRKNSSSQKNAGSAASQKQQFRRFKKKDQPYSSCSRCGRKSHEPKDCPANEWTCFKCGKRGHVSKCCTTSVNIIEILEHPVKDIVSQVCTVDAEKVSILLDDVYKVDFEIDSGSAFTLMPLNIFNDFCKCSSKSKLMPTATKLGVANGSFLGVSGKAVVDITVGSEKFKTLNLIITDSTLIRPLLGREWLDVINPFWRKRLIKSVFSVSENVSQSVKTKSVSNSDNLEIVTEIKRNFPNVFPESNSDPIKFFEASIILKEGTQPIFHRAYDLAYALRDSVKEEFEGLERQGICQKVSHSDWATPVVVARRKDGRIRCCGNFKVTVNKYCDVDHYPLPIIEDLFNKFVNCHYFCKIDLTNAYLQLKVAESSKPLLTLNTHIGLFRFNRMIFGLSSAPSIFQNVIDEVLKGLSKTGAYLDDILCGGRDKKECTQNLFKVFQRLNDYNIKINLEKCQFLIKSVEFLGYILDSRGLHPCPDKVEAIRYAPPPTDISQLRSFLGFLNYYHKFIPMSSDILEPLHNLTRDSVPWEWSVKCQKAFDKAKSLVTEKTTLVLYDPALPIVVAADASSYGVGAVLSHIVESGEKPVAFASSTLSKTERNYSQLDREALALIFAVKKFYKYIYGRKFLLITDHEPLQSIFNPKKSIPQLAAARLQHWAILLSMYSYDIKYRKGSSIGHADALSRLPVVTASTGVYVANVSAVENFENQMLSYQEIALATTEDLTLSQVKEFVKNGWPMLNSLEPDLRPYHRVKISLSLEKNCLLYGNRVVIPKKLQSHVLVILHENHPGIVRCKMLARSFVWWAGIEDDITRHIQSCVACQTTQNDSSEKIYIPMAKSLDPWVRVNLDFLETLNLKFLILVDDTSKWAEVWIVGQTTAPKILMLLSDCFARFGLPRILVTDNGPPFNSAEFKAYFDKRNVQFVTSPPYHPSSNGLAERGVQTIKRMLLRSVVAGANNVKISPQERLTSCLASYRSTPSTVTKLSPADIMFKFKVRTSMSMLSPSDNVRFQKPNFDGVIEKYRVNEKVLVRNSDLKDKVKWIPGRVMERLSAVLYLVKWKHEKFRRVHVNQLKRSCLDDSVHPPEREWDFIENQRKVEAPRESNASLNSPPRSESPPLAIRRTKRKTRPPQKYSP